jgi:hypothetical protein
LLDLGFRLTLAAERLAAPTAKRFAQGRLRPPYTQSPGIGEGWFTLHPTPGDRYQSGCTDDYFP